MAAVEVNSLESFLNRATNACNAQEDWEAIMGFCDQINKELEGPQIAVRLLAHKLQSPQEREALYALSSLEACVKNCGKRFHQEIGKFRFLNELIKVVSPKYLGSHTSDGVKRRVVELMYSWSQGLPNEPKVAEAYQMLKRQGIIKQDPTYMDKTLESPEPVPQRQSSLFDDGDKAKLLARLLKSKQPEDLQAANRLIKNMVKQDAERMEKTSKRVQELETVHNNLKVLTEMLTHYEASYASEAEKDVMKELYDNLEKSRPKLFRLASDTEERDSDAINQILEANDTVMKVMTQYRTIVENKVEEDRLLIGVESQEPSGPSEDSSVSADSKVSTNNIGSSKFDLDELNDLFSSMNNNSSLLSSTPPQDTQLGAVTGDWVSADTSFPAPLQPQKANSALDTTPLAPAVQSVDATLFSNVPSASMSVPGLQPNILKPVEPVQQPQIDKSTGLNALDQLGQSLMQQSLPASQMLQPSPLVKVPMNQMKPVSLSATPGAISAGLGTTSPLTVSSSPSKKTASSQSINIEALTNVFVQIESLQPSKQAPKVLYDKDGVRVLIHASNNQPRPDVQVLALSVVSTAPAAISKFVFQAAVPKVMKVKLQPPTATELTAYNPILPPSAITQIMLVANPQQERVRLKYKITFSMNGDSLCEIGEIDSLMS